MKNNIYIKALSDGKIYKGECGNLELKVSDEVLIESEQGQEVGVVVDAPVKAEEGEDSVSIIRKLTEKDREKCRERKKEAKEVLPACLEKIKKHGLAMDLLDADISYDGKKLTFYFSAPGRVDFRSLVPDLASTFKKLIRLQQVASRDKAKCIDGVVGRCGRSVCCKTLGKCNFEDVNVEMANIQNIGQMGTNRITGACGKLMCCLKFELDSYKKMKKSMPEIGSGFKTKEGDGVVVSQNFIKGRIVVELTKDKRIVEVDC